MTDSGRIIFVNRFYWPDEPATGQLLTDLAEALAARKYGVTVIASHPAEKNAPPKMRNGVEMIRVRGLRLGRRNLLLKALDYLSFALAARTQISRVLRPGDTLVMMTDPPLLGATVTGLVRRRGARIIHWIQDIYPEIAVTVSGARVAGIFRTPRDLAWRKATACVVLGSDMSAFVRERGVSPEKTIVVPNWAPAGLAPLTQRETSELRAKWSLTGKFVVVYSGNLGRVHELDPVIEIATALRAEDGIVFLFIGDGAQKTPLEEAVRARGLTNVLFHCPQPRTQLGETLALADLHLVTLREGCERLVFPSKLYGIAAVGRPLLFIGPPRCELAQLVATHGFGLAHARDEIQPAADAILRLRDDPVRCVAMGHAAEKFWHSHGRLESAVKRWIMILGEPKPLATAASRAPK